jgi:predicted nuclease of predicted toxin-antitoxin system
VRIKLDENLPHRLVQLLGDLGHDVDTVPDEGIGGRDDSVVWDRCPVHGRFLITQDLDFSDARKYVPGTHHGLLLVRIPQPGREALFNRVSALFQHREPGGLERLHRHCDSSQSPRQAIVR